MIVTSTQKEGSSYYHIYDNRVFPKHIDDIVECPQEVFEDPNYRIDDRNINSAIQSPTHCAKVPISQESFTVGRVRLQWGRHARAPCRNYAQRWDQLAGRAYQGARASTPESDGHALLLGAL